MNSNMNNWGYSTPQAQTANKVDLIADKVKFVATMANNTLIALDEVQRELLALSNAPTPPRKDQLQAIAGRISTYQKQLKDNFTTIEQLSVDIDKTTDIIQNNGSGWGY